MNKQELLGYLERLDQHLRSPTVLYVYGSAAFILLDEPDRTSLDIDVAAPYSIADFTDLCHAAERAGLPVNPDESSSADHIEWISAVRLSLPKPDPSTELVLWQGKNLRVKTVSFSELVASKLVRYDPADQGDIEYLHAQGKVDVQAVADAVRRLPPPFNRDVLVQENLANLASDIAMWRKQKP